MKKVGLKVVEISENGASASIDYREQILAVLKAPENPNGTDYDEMRKVLPIIEKVESAGDYVLLEDAEHDEVTRRFKKAKFGSNHPAIFDMIDEIVSAPPYLVEADASTQ